VTVVIVFLLSLAGGSLDVEVSFEVSLGLEVGLK